MGTDVVTIQERDIDRSPEAAVPSAACMDQLMGIGIGHLSGKEAKACKDQHTVHQVQTTLGGKGPEDQGK